MQPSQSIKVFSIRFKLITVMIGLTFVSSVMLTMVVYREVSTQITFQFNHHAETANQNVKTFLSLTAGQIEQLSMSILANDEIQSGIRKIGNEEEIAPELMEFYSQKIENEFLGLTLGRDEIRGIVLMADKGPTFSLLLDPAISIDSVGTEEVSKIKAAAGSPVWLRTDNKSRTVPMGRVFVDTMTQTPVGTLILFFREKYFADLFHAIKMYDNETQYLLTQDGYVISHPDKDKLGSSLQTPYRERILANTSDSFFTYSDSEQNFHLWSFYMPDYKWLLVKTIPSKIIAEPATTLRYRMLVIGFLFWGIAALLGLALSKGISEPIHRLLTAIRGFKSNTKNNRVNWSSNDEIGNAVLAYNNLLDHLEKAEADLYEANRAKGDFLMTMGHELRTPLNGILLANELISNDNSIEQTNQIKHIIGISGKNLLTSIERILNFTQSKNGELESSHKPFNLNQILLQLKRKFTHRGVETELNLKIKSYSEEIPVMLIGDGDRLIEVLNLFLENATKFSETAPEATLNIDLVDLSEKSVRLRFSLIDNGIGISPEYHQKIFEPFFQVDNSLSRQYDGIGIGLAICKQLVELMNGEIGVESRTREGSTFYFYVNIDIADKEA